MATEQLHYDEQTLFKVFHGLVDTGMTEQQAMGAITAMQNQGILFRERLPEPPKSKVEAVDRFSTDSRWRPIDSDGTIAADPAPELPDDPDEGETGPPEEVISDRA